MKKSTTYILSAFVIALVLIFVAYQHIHPSAKALVSKDLIPKDVVTPQQLKEWPFTPPVPTRDPNNQATKLIPDSECPLNAYTTPAGFASYTNDDFIFKLSYPTQYTIESGSYPFRYPLAALKEAPAPLQSGAISLLLHDTSLETGGNYNEDHLQLNVIEGYQLSKAELFNSLEYNSGPWHSDGLVNICGHIFEKYTFEENREYGDGPIDDVYFQVRPRDDDSSALTKTVPYSQGVHYLWFVIPQDVSPSFKKDALTILAHFAPWGVYDVTQH